jgi:flavin reductase (DIM6/NTAB) family NADH-FMN oxidoreductase RutF
VVIGRVVAVHIDDAALTLDGRVDILKIRPIARLGYKDYTSVESVFQMEKQTPEDA